MAGKDAISVASLVTAASLRALGISLVVLGTLLVIGRYAILGARRRLWQWEDSFIVGAWACFFTICILYVWLIPHMFRILHFEADGFQPYPTLVSDGTIMVRVFFPATMLHWSCLWFVKFAFMAQIKRLINRQRNYIIAWWSILVLTCLLYVGCIVSEFTSCSSLHDWFTFGACATTHDARAALISLYYAFASDVLTDLLILMLPIRLLWNLQITRGKKIRILSLFFVVGLGICAAVVRVIAIKAVSDNNQPSPSWLAMWAIVEAFIAIIVGCMPAYGMLWSAAGSRSKRYEYRGDGSDDTFSHGLSDRRSSRKSAVHDGSQDVEGTGTGSKHRTFIEAISKADDLEPLHDDDKAIYMTTTVDAHSSKLSSRDGTSDNGSISRADSLG